MTNHVNFKDELDFEQNLLRDTAADFVKSRLSTAVVRRLIASETGVDADIWKQIAEMGWTGLLVPEAYGGLYMKVGAIALILQELGRSAYQGPFFTTAVACVLAISRCDNESFKQAVLPELATGSMICSLAMDEGVKYLRSGFSTRAVSSGQGVRMSGAKLFVPYAHVADKLIVVASCEEGVGFFSVDRDQSGVKVDILPTISGAKLCQVRMENAHGEALLSDVSKGSAIVEEVFHYCALLMCAEMVGGAISAIELTVEHVTHRKQFGAPIGTFQAVQHKCADMLTYLDAARLLLNDGLKAVEDQADDLVKIAAINKIWTSDAYRQITKLAHQLMAGTGYMEETDLQLYFRHAKVCELAFGAPGFYRDVLADQLGI